MVFVIIQAIISIKIINVTTKSRKLKLKKNINRVRKELAILIKEKVSEYPCFTESKILTICRQYINLKYGNDWRERGLISNDSNQWKPLDQYINPDFDWNVKLFYKTNYNV